MNCARFQEILPEVINGGRNAEQEAHLQSCPVCSSLITDLNLIVAEARELREFAEPAPRVWNSIELALRQEGLIRDPMGASLLPPVRRHGAWPGWPRSPRSLCSRSASSFTRGVPANANRSHKCPPPLLPRSSNYRLVKNQKTVNNEDQQLLEAVASRAPTMQAAYASNLENVNAYIRDAEASAQADPNDEEAQQVVMDAYEQRATIYEMALDRSLP